MDVFLQAVVVIGAVVIGVRFGSIGLGICGGGGLMILNQVFGLRPTGAPVDVILIILAVVTAASTMQAASTAWSESQNESFARIPNALFSLHRSSHGFSLS